jgi:hypothetical protein
MKPVFRHTAAGELPQVRSFLRDVFGAPNEAPWLNERQLFWKYYVGREDAADSRSFVFDSGDEIAAHACAWPFEVIVDGETVSGHHPIDWAAGSSVPGAGALLLRQMRAMKDICCCVGGTDIAQKVIAQSGFRPRGDCRYYARPLRPVQQMMTRGQRNWKAPLRAIRNTAWIFIKPSRKSADWSSELIEPNQLPVTVLPHSDTSALVMRRTPAVFEYLKECPTTRFSLYLAVRHGHPSGYFLLSHTPGQARIADFWAPEPQMHVWAALVSLAIESAYADPSVAEITASCSLPWGQSALEACGFRPTHSLPIMSFDPKKKLARPVPLHFQMVDNDFSFLHEGRPAYQT